MSRWLPRTLLALGLIGLTLGIGGWAARYRFNVSGSLPIGVYQVVAPSLTRGSLVLACLPRSVARLARERGYVHRGSCPSGDAPIGKRVLAVAGDTVEVSARGITIDGRLVPSSAPLTRDSHGGMLPRVAPERSIVRYGTVWLFSNHSPHSFDSRYFGAVAVCTVIGGLRVVVSRHDMPAGRDAPANAGIASAPSSPMSTNSASTRLPATVAHTTRYEIVALSPRYKVCVLYKMSPSFSKFCHP